MHNDYTLFWRTYPNGKKVVFYYAYDDKDVRQGPWTTKCQSITVARNYCNRLIKADALIPKRGKPLTFGEYAKGFWERGSDYLTNQEGRADITLAYIDNCKKMTANQILPFFADIPLEKITYRDVNKWLLGFKNREITVGGKKEIKSYKNTYANTVFGTLYTMMAWAVEQELIKINPCAKVKKLKNDRKKIEIITVGEVRKLFPKNWKTVWEDKEIAYTANRLASLTGMRAGEIMGLRGEYVFDDYIYVCGSYGEYGYGPTKTKETRFIPLIPEMIGLLKKLTEKNGKGYVFSLDGGGKPVCRKYFYDEFHRALKRIGVDQAEITRRGLSIHSWRHFLNTELQTQGLTLEQVQAVTGHKSDRMSEWYTHFDARKLSDVMEAQRVITGAKKPGKAGEGTKGAAAKAGTGKQPGRPDLKIVKMPERKETPARKRA
ncbi:MAG: tyrosine-type recombinase/integrase [Treponema sp.]|nr:tyrosine-type recombinase/integrase [Treponema sp.]